MIQPMNTRPWEKLLLISAGARVGLATVLCTAGGGA